MNCFELGFVEDEFDEELEAEIEEGELGDVMEQEPDEPLEGEFWGFYCS